MTEAASNNLFVIGDLVIDHSVIVKDHREADSGVLGLEVIRRIDTAGGAANCARILATLSSGNTFLWGLIGYSVWGGFRRILENSQTLDGSHSAIKFRGVQDETNARMNTITRVLRVSDDGEFRDVVLRFDDYGHVHVPDDKRKSALHYLRRLHEKYTIHGVIIDDLDMNCLKAPEISEIENFCSPRNIPLFVNPKFTLKNYADTKGTAILASLDEWLLLVGNSEPKANWLAQLDHPEAWTRMAHLSLKHLGGFESHIILCGDMGSVIVLPAKGLGGKYDVYRAKAPETKKGFAQPKLGCSDVMTAAFALGLSSHSDRTNQRILEAFADANAAVGCFQDMNGPRMPSRDVVHHSQQSTRLPVKQIEWLAGVLYLPSQSRIQLSDQSHSMRVPTLYSVDQSFREVMDGLVADIETEWESELKSLILGAPSASGKTTLLNQLDDKLGEELNIHFKMVKDVKEFKWKDIYSSLKAFRNGLGTNERLLIAFDEAAKSPMIQRLETYGVRLIDAAHECNTRLLFVGVEFSQDDSVSLTSEFTSRCRPFHLPPLNERFGDVPYIIGAMLFKLTDTTVKSITVERDFLLALINQTIKKPNLRAIENHVGSAYKTASKAAQTSGLVLKLDHLPSSLRGLANDRDKPDISDYEFVRGE